MNCSINFSYLVQIIFEVEKHEILYYKCGLLLDPAKPSCQLGMFSCDNNRCLPLAVLCNGRADCYDESDEKDCDSTNKIYQVYYLWFID